MMLDRYQSTSRHLVPAGMMAATIVLSDIVLAFTRRASCHAEQLEQEQ
jgi:hypothetical protein